MGSMDTAAEGEIPDLRHLVAVLETGAVFVVLLERGRPDGGGDGDRSADRDDSVGGEDASKGGRESDTVHRRDSSNGTGKNTRSEYVRLGMDRADDPKFDPTWLDVGRGGNGGGGGGMGVRAMPPGWSAGSGAVVGSQSAGLHLHMSIVSRAWGNKCTVKMLKLAAMPARGGADTEGHRREWGNNKPQAIRTETVRQVTLPTDHPSPEQHALAAVDGNWVILASPPAGGAPAVITVAPLGQGERPVPSSMRAFTLPHGEQVGGVALLTSSHMSSIGPALRPVSAEGQTVQEVFRPAWGLVWSDAAIYRVDFGQVGRTPRTDVDVSTGPLPASPPPPPPPLPPPPRESTRTTGSARANPTASIVIRRPPAAAIRRAHELHAVGDIAEAAQVAMEALDGNRPMSSAVAGGGSGGARQAPPGKEKTGGGATTRMLREDLANSLLEWLITLHVRRSCPRALALHEENTPSPGSATADGPTSSIGRPGAGATQAGEVRRASKQTSLVRTSKRVERKGTETEKTRPLPPVPARASSRLETFLLKSRDYDPVLAATLLHAHGEADLAIIAGTARGGNAISGVIRVLTESSWPPRLGPRAVEALCANTAAGEAIRAGGGTLLAALEPRLQVRMLMSNGRISSGTRGSTSGELSLAASKTGEATMASLVAPSEGTLGGVRSHILPLLPVLPAEDLAELVSRLVQWCRDSSLDSVTVEASEPLPQNVGAYRELSSSFPSCSAREAVDFTFNVLFELSGREPPLGPEHRRAWLNAGCTGRSTSVPNTEVDNSSAAFSTTMAPARASVALDMAVSPEALEVQGDASEWPRAAASLCRVLNAEGLCGEGVHGDSGGGDQIVGGLPTAARRVLLRALPLLRRWYDPVRVLLKARGSGCWAAVALQLELAGNRREAASARLHGVVATLQVMSLSHTF